MKAINPATEELIREYAEHGESEVEARLRRAEQSFSAWRMTSLEERSDLLARAAGFLRGRRGDYARLMRLGRTE